MASEYINLTQSWDEIRNLKHNVRHTPREDFLGDEEKTGNNLSSDLAKIMEKLFKGKNSLEKVKELSANYDRVKTGHTCRDP